MSDRPSVEEVLAEANLQWCRLPTIDPPPMHDFYVNALAAAAEDGPLIDRDRGIAVIRLDPDERHQIQFTNDGWTIQHPLHERLDGSLFDCDLRWVPDVDPDSASLHGNKDPGLRGVFWLDDDGTIGARIVGGEQSDVE